MMRFKIGAVIGFLLWPALGLAQGAQFPAGTLWGNDTASQRPGKAVTVTGILDRALGSTRGNILERGASGWAVIGPGTTGFPFVSNGAGADPAYQRLGLVGGGTNADLSATGGASFFLRQNSAGAAITVVQPNFTDLAGRATLAQVPQGIANSIFINPTGSTANMQNIAVPACANDGAHGLSYTNGTGLICSTMTGAAGANPSATASDTAVNGVAVTFLRSDGAPAVQKGTNAAFGVVQGDNVTVTCAAGVCGQKATSVVNSLGSDTAISNAGYTDGPSTAQGTSGTWLATGTVTFQETTTAMQMSCKLWDGTTVISSLRTTLPNPNQPYAVSLSGVLAAPAANIRISCTASTTTSTFKFNSSGNSKDSTLTTYRIQ